MYRSIESLMLAEFVTDLMALWAALRGRCLLPPGKLFMHSAFGAAICALFSISGVPPIVSRSCGMLCCFLNTALLIGGTGIRKLMMAFCTVLAVSALMSVFIDFVPYRLRIPGAVIAASASALIAGTSHRWQECWDAYICAEASGNCVHMSGIIDTGNRLREPLSGLPVIVAAHSAILPLLPYGFMPDAPETHLHRGFRMVSYGGLGGCGCLGCFIPDRLSLHFDNASADVSGIWIAVYPGPLPGGHDVLIPAAAVDMLHKKTKRRNILCPVTDR